MANRILVGSRTTGGYGLYVSKSGEDVLDCDKEDLSFWTDHGESGTGFVAEGLSQLVPVSGGATSAPVESATIDISNNATAAVSYQDLGADVMVMGGFTVSGTAGSGGSAVGIKFTSVSGTAATANRSYSADGGTFRVCTWKTLGKGETLY